MLEIIAIVLISIVFGTLLQEKIGLPSTIFYILVGLFFAHFFPEIMQFDSHSFHYLVLVTLPFLIASDTFGITWESIKKNYVSIILLAVVNVIFTVLGLVVFGDFLLGEVGILMLILLASTISPTDPVGVNAALANFKVPHKLSFKLESESLANDVVALAIFSITIGLVLGKINPDFFTISGETIKIFGESLVIGIIIGFITVKFLSWTDDAFKETFIILTAIFVGFLLSDHYFHSSGIFSVIVIMLLINEEIKKYWKKLNVKEETIVHPKNHNFVEKILYFMAMASNSFLFIALGSLVDFLDPNSFVWEYVLESFYIFLFITFLRGVFMYFYAYFSRKTKKIDRIDSVRWWAVLTFGGMRGGLSVLMIFILASLVPDYKYLEEFKAIVFNVVFLITFIYTPILIFIFKKYKKDFDKEYEYEKKHEM